MNVTLDCTEPLSSLKIGILNLCSREREDELPVYKGVAML